MPAENISVTLAYPPKPGKKYFNSEEANEALPYVSRVVGDITSYYRLAVQIRQQIERPGVDDDTEQLRVEYESVMDRLNALVDELQQVGVELKDFERGLIDFPCVHEGREICLCWHLGEDVVGAWHEIDAGYAGRQDVSVLHA